MFFHSPGSFDAAAYDRNKKIKKVFVKWGEAHGTLVYCGADPVGWCQFGPREELRRIDSKRNYLPTSEDAWRVTCLFTDRHHRRSGIAGVAVERSLDAMGRLGVKHVEAYPVEGSVSASMLWSGTPGLFEKHGFKRVRPLGKSSWIYSTELR